MCKHLIAHFFETMNKYLLNNNIRVSVLPLESSMEDVQQHGFLIQLRALASSAVHLAAQASVPSDKPYYDPRCGFLSLPGPSPLQSALWKLPGMKRRMCGTLLQLEWWGVQ